MAGQNDGGPAFGGHLQFSHRGNCANSDATIGGGLSLRDYFAAAALQALVGLMPHQEAPGRTARDSMAREVWEHGWGDPHGGFYSDKNTKAPVSIAQHTAEAAYAIADAMLKARGE